MTWDGELVGWVEWGFGRECWGVWGCVEEEGAEGGLSPDALEVG